MGWYEDNGMARPNTKTYGTSGTLNTSSKNNTSNSNKNSNKSSNNSNSSNYSVADAIKKAQDAYNAAKAKGDTAGMEKAHKDAEAERAKSGYSGGVDGSQNVSIPKPISYGDGKSGSNNGNSSQNVISKPVNISSSVDGQYTVKPGDDISGMSQQQKSIAYGAQDWAKADTGKYAYLDDYGFSHVGSLAQALAYSKDGNVQAYTGSSKGGYATDAQGNRAMVDMPGVVQYGNAAKDEKGNVIQYKPDGSLSGQVVTLKDILARQGQVLNPNQQNSIQAPQGQVYNSNQQSSNQSPTFTKTLAYGARGDDVKAIQKALGVAADGILGKDTRAAIMAYQKNTGLATDGVVGKDTWTSIFQANPPNQEERQEGNQQAPSSNNQNLPEWAVNMKTGLVNNPNYFADEAARIQGIYDSGKATEATDRYKSQFQAFQDALNNGDDVNQVLSDISSGKYDNYTRNNVAPQATGQVSEKTELEQKLVDMLTQNEQFDPQKVYDQILGTYSPVELKESMSYEDAIKQASTQLDPTYDTARNQRMDELDREMLATGFFGQKPAARKKLTDAELIENDRASAIANLASQYVNQSKDDVYKEATFNQSERNAQASTLLSALQQAGVLSQNNISNIMSMLTYNENKDINEYNRNRQDKLDAYNQDVTTAGLTGMFRGKPTVDYTLAMEELGMKKAAAEMAEKQANASISQAWARINNSKSSSNSKAGSAQGDFDTFLRDVKEQAFEKAIEVVKGASSEYSPEEFQDEVLKWVNIYQDLYLGNNVSAIDANKKSTTNLNYGPQYD